MRKLILLAAVASLGITAFPAFAAPQGDSTTASATPVAKPKPQRRTSNCADRVLCRKIDSLSARVNALSATVAAGNASEASYYAKQSAATDQMLTSLKAIEAQGSTQQRAILLTFADRQLAEDQDPATVANQLCLDAGFKSGKPVDVSKKGGWFSGHTLYLKSVVCTY